MEVERENIAGKTEGSKYLQKISIYLFSINNNPYTEPQLISDYAHQ